MPMEDLNAAPTFLTMAMKVQIEWEELAKKHGLNIVASKIFDDDVLLYGLTAE